MCDKALKNEKLKITERDDAIKNIVINYNDGTTKTIEKGVVCEIGVVYDEEAKQDMLNLSMEMASMSGKDMIDFIYGVMSLYAKLEEKHSHKEEVLEEE